MIRVVGVDTQESLRTWFMASAQHVSADIYRVAADAHADTQLWEFQPGAHVRCVPGRLLDFDGRTPVEGLLAVEQVEPS